MGDSDYEVVTWSSGSLDLVDLVGKPAYGLWKAGFKANEMSVRVGGKMTTFGMVIMQDFKMTVNYEYDSLTSY